MKAALIGFFSNGPQSDCTMIEKLQGLACPSPNDRDFNNKMNQAVIVLGIALIEATLACLCNALLPPAPCGTSDDRVPLAIVTVRKSDCKVLRVCNWTHLRKLVITWPTLEYWFGWIPFFSKIQDVIALFCCADFGRFIPDDEGRGRRNTEAGYMAHGYDKVNIAPHAQAVKDNQTMTSLLMSTLARFKTTLDPAAVLNGVFGFELESKDAMTEAEKANIAPFLLLNEVLRPMAAGILPGVPAASQRKFEEEVTEQAAKAKQAESKESELSLHLRVEALEKAIKEMGGKVP